MIKKILFTIFAVLVIVAVSWNIAYSENMFFHCDVKVLSRNEPIIIYETYNLCTNWAEPIEPECLIEEAGTCFEWTEAEEPECLEWMIPRPMRVKSSTPHIVYYEAYVIAGQEFKELPVPCEWNGLDVVHVSSNDMSLKNDVAYLCDSYTAMAEISQDLSDACMKTTYEVEEIDPEDGKLKKVKKHVTTKVYKEKGRPEKKLKVNIPHKYFGVEVDGEETE